ncbi:MAG: hypothetical protein NWE77_00575 [Candidatus Bathyarchaeota archaeon]|nr:hypothetical protein [Candidatus Bathyarchaeota archaeon]
MIVAIKTGRRDSSQSVPQKRLSAKIQATAVNTSPTSITGMKLGKTGTAKANAVPIAIPEKATKKPFL